MNIFTNKNRVLIIILCVFVFIELIGLFYMQFFRSFDHQDVKKNNDFQYRETLMCHVIHTTRTRGGLYLPYYDEKTFVLTKLNTDTPEFLRAEGQTWGKYNQKYDGEGYITLEMESSWDSDVIGLNKDTGTFVRTMQGIEGGKFQYAIAQKGYCE